MNVDTGEIKMMRRIEAKKLGEEWTEINMADATKKQRRDMSVSLFDSKSKLGKARVAHKAKLKKRRKNERRRKRESKRQSR